MKINTLLTSYTHQHVGWLFIGAWQ